MSDVQHYAPASTRSTTNGDNSFYIFNFEDGGFAIVPVDKRATDVYALSDEGSFTTEGELPTYIMSLASNYLDEELDQASSDGAVFNPGGLGGGGGFEPAPDPDDPRNYAIVDFNGQPCHRKVETTQSTPYYLIKTEWHQYSPYNDLCKTSTGESAPAGCVAIALAQIMGYHQQPKTHNGHIYLWNELTRTSNIGTNSSLASNVSLLIHDIGLAVDMEYGTNGSYSDITHAKLGLLQFGYLGDINSSANINDILRSLNNSLPIYMRGTTYNPYTKKDEGHAWVIDGLYTITTKYTYYSTSTLSPVGSTSEYKRYLHCNWGWQEEYLNGYYVFEVFNPGEYEFYNSSLKIIHNIRR